MITRRTVLFLGLSQLVCWGISYYLIAAFGEVIADELGWSSALVYGGFSAALVVMGLTSPLTGKLIDQYSGRFVMSAGSLLLAISCAGIALSQSVLAYYISWIVLGFAMRLSLYDAAFATLVRIAGSGAKRSISQITLLGGLASTVFWPIGFFLSEAFGWRTALLVYAGFALLTLPLHLAIPKERFQESETDEELKSAAFEKLNLTGRERIFAGSLYALIFTLLNFLNSAMSAHMIAILSGLGLAAAVSVWISTLRGIGQSLARVAEILFGGRLHPFKLTVLASSLLPLCFVIGLFSGDFLAMAFIFAFLYGAGNGLMTITRGSLPLVLFDNRTYGAFVGKLLVPSFLLSAIAPVFYTVIIEHYGEQTTLLFSVALAFVVFAATLWLKKRYTYTEAA